MSVCGKTNAATFTVEQLIHIISKIEIKIESFSRDSSISMDRSWRPVVTTQTVQNLMQTGSEPPTYNGYRQPLQRG